MTALNRLLSSFPFRVTLAYMGVFVLAAVLIVSFIAWRANELLTTKVIETLTAEVVGLREQFQTGGPARLRTAVTERAAEPGSGLYLLLERLAPGTMITLNRIVAQSMVLGPSSAIADLDGLSDSLSGHHRVHAVRAHLLEQSGDPAAARSEYQRAARLTRSIPEQRYLEAQASRLA